jgi:hypothetical protein
MTMTDFGASVQVERAATADVQRGMEATVMKA